MSKKTPPTAAPKRMGRPPGKTAPKPHTGVRIPPELLARLDRVVERRQRELAFRGQSTSRTAVINEAVADLCDREEAAEKAPARGAT